MNGRCRPNPFHFYFTITAIVFNLSFINLAKDWHYYFALWAFVINYWPGFPLKVFCSREMVGIEPTMALPPRHANLPFRSPPTTWKRGDLFYFCCAPNCANNAATSGVIPTMSETT